MSLFSTVYRLFRAPVFSPMGLIIRALLLLGILLALDLAGFRDYTCVFTGTSPTGNPNDQGAILMGLIYVAVYFANWIFTPVLLLAGLFQALYLGFCSETPKYPE